MKREIKFRAWYKVLKHWADFPQDVCGINDMCLMDVLNNDDYEVCQYTGLKDKNGVEIYEGDIVSCYDRFNQRLDFIGEVFYNTKLLMYDFKNKSGYTKRYRNYPTLEYEVIGNVYQNPELLYKRCKQNKQELIRTMPECPFSWSKQHSFERSKWRIAGESPQCKWCGFVDDLTEQEEV